MAAFALLPSSLYDAVHDQKLKAVFEEKGFRRPEVHVMGNFSLLWYPSIGGSSAQVWNDQQGNVIAVTGTCYFRGKLLSRDIPALFESIRSSHMRDEEFQGTFCLLVYQAATDRILCLHDAAAIFRFYTDTRTGAISSSFLALARIADHLNLNQDVLGFNLVFGFNPGVHTWINGIERVLHGRQLPEKMDYRRLEVAETISEFHNKQEALQASADLLVTKMKVAINHDRRSFLGLSSGYDSRLMAALLSHTTVHDLSFFTFHKPGASDPVIAQKIAQSMGIELIKKATGRPNDYDAQEEVFRKAFNFFDGQAVTMMQYSKPDYTAPFRMDVMGADAVHFSGVGGELFRNYNYDHGFSSGIRQWMNTYLLAGADISYFIPGDQAAAVNTLFTNYIQSELECSSTIRLADRKKFYGDLFLRDWHSVRNSAENQFCHYYTPFSDREVIAMSYATRPYQGRGGNFEADLIRILSPTLAKISSGYGYAFDAYPGKAKVLDALRCMVKMPALASWNKPAETGAASRLTEFEKEQLTVFSTLGLSVQTNNLLNSSKRFEPMLSAAYSLKHLFNL